MDEIPLGDEEYNEILMHRDSHFSGKFDEMISYYQKIGRGVQEKIDLRKILELADWEATMKQNAAAILLSANEIEQIASAKKAYRSLQDLYLKELSDNHPQKLIADLILTESEDPIAEREAIIRQKEILVPLLIDLLKSNEMHNPLFPGYGLTPIEVAKCLGEIGDSKALFPLFEELGKGDFFDDEMLIKAFKSLGDPAKDFLLKIVGTEPITSDNEKAAIALSAFKNDLSILESSLTLLKNPSMQKEYPYSGYLAHLFDEINDPKLKESYKEIAYGEKTPKPLKMEMDIVIKQWE
ncbi:hypothetical protein N9Y92_01110 [Chlamydiales bacterium]|nr:hypothetical protein [Chlamydiales bacterium]